MQNVFMAGKKKMEPIVLLFSYIFTFSIDFYMIV